MAKIKLLLVDDHQIVRAGLRMLFMAEPDVEIVGEASSGEEALAAVPRCQPDIVLMDAAMPGMSGMEATRRIKEAFPNVAVLALTMHEDERYFFEMLNAGASGYVPKRAAPDELMSAIRVVSQGDVFIYPSLARQRHRCAAAEAAGDFVELVQLAGGFDVEAVDARLQRRTHLGARLADAGEHDSVRTTASGQHARQLAA